MKCQSLLHQGMGREQKFLGPVGHARADCQWQSLAVPHKCLSQSWTAPTTLPGCRGKAAAMLVQSESAYQQHHQLSVGIGSLALALCRETAKSDACVCSSTPWLWQQHVLSQRAVLWDETLACCRRPCGQD